MRDGGEGEIKVSGGSLYSLTIDLCYAQLFVDQLAKSTGYLCPSLWCVCIVSYCVYCVY